MAQDAHAMVVAALIESLPQPAVAVDRKGRIRLSNRAAAELIERSHGLRSDHGQLRPCCPAAAERLAQALEAQAERDSGTRFLVTGGGNGAPPLLIAAAPIPHCCGLEATSLLSIAELAEPRTVAPELLQSLFGLSPAEARIAAGLGAGEELGPLAERLGIRSGTARSQLKTVFRKLGIRRQQDLVRLVTQIGCLCRGGAVD